jgi:hypothetical protein
VPGQARAVTAGALDPDQAHGPEPAQPAQQPRVADLGRGELLDAELPADRVERGGDVSIGVGVHPAGDGACLYDGQRHPFSEVEGWHAPAGRRTWETPASSQDGQIRPAAPVGAAKPGTRPADR